MYSPAACLFRGRIFVIKNSVHSFHPGVKFLAYNLFVSNHSLSLDTLFAMDMGISCPEPLLVASTQRHHLSFGQKSFKTNTVLKKVKFFSIFGNKIFQKS
jgi:hypothetical protein